MRTGVPAGASLKTRSMSRLASRTQPCDTAPRSLRARSFRGGRPGRLEPSPGGRPSGQNCRARRHRTARPGCRGGTARRRSSCRPALASRAPRPLLAPRRRAFPTGTAGRGGSRGRPRSAHPPDTTDTSDARTQPVLPFGRVGSCTQSQSGPQPSPCEPSTPKTVGNLFWSSAPKRRTSRARASGQVRTEAVRRTNAPYARDADGVHARIGAVAHDTGGDEPPIDAEPAGARPLMRALRP